MCFSSKPSGKLELLVSYAQAIGSEIIFSHGEWDTSFYSKFYKLCSDVYGYIVT